MAPEGCARRLALDGEACLDPGSEPEAPCVDVFGAYAEVVGSVLVEGFGEIPILGELRVRP